MAGDSTNWRIILMRLVDEQRKEVWQDLDLKLQDMISKICDENQIEDRPTKVKLVNAHGDVSIGAASPGNILRVFKEVGIKNADVWSEKMLEHIVHNIGDKVLNQSDYLREKLDREIG